MKELMKCITVVLLWFTVSTSVAQKLRVMTYNIHHGADRNEVNTIDSIGYFIKSQAPDIVGLQEVDSVCTRSGKVDQMKRLAEITGMHYTFIQHFPYQGGAYGLGVLSKYPIEKTERKKLKLLKPGQNGNSVSMLFATVAVSKKKKLLFVTAHYSAFDQATRDSQVTETFQYLDDYHLPIILTGDLNATPDNPVIGRLTGRLSNVDPSSKYTFPDDEPNKAIDYILVSPKHLKKVVSIAVQKVHHSDHRPLTADIKLK